MLKLYKVIIMLNKPPFTRPLENDTYEFAWLGYATFSSFQLLNPSNFYQEHRHLMKKAGSGTNIEYDIDYISADYVFGMV